MLKTRQLTQILHSWRKSSILSESHKWSHCHFESETFMCCSHSPCSPILPTRPGSGSNLTTFTKPGLTGSIPQFFFPPWHHICIKLSLRKSFTLSELQFPHLKAWIKTLPDKFVDEFKCILMCPCSTHSRCAANPVHLTCPPYLPGCVWRVGAWCERQDDKTI